MKMKYAGYKVNINAMDDGLRTALKVSEILKGFEKEKIKAEINTTRLWITKAEINTDPSELDNDELVRQFDAMIFKIFLPKKKADLMSKLIPINFFKYVGNQAICETIQVDANEKYDGSGTITLIYPLDYNISYLLEELGTIKSLDIRGEKFYPLAAVDNYDDALDSIFEDTLTLYHRGWIEPEDYMIAHITGPNNRLEADNFLPDTLIMALPKK